MVSVVNSLISSRIYVILTGYGHNGVAWAPVSLRIYRTSYLKVTFGHVVSTHDLERSPLYLPLLLRSPQVDYLKRGNGPSERARDTVQDLRILFDGDSG